MEQNDIEDASSLLDEWRRGGLLVCRVLNDCSQSYCRLGFGVHLPYFTWQREYHQSDTYASSGGTQRKQQNYGCFGCAPRYPRAAGADWDEAADWEEEDWLEEEW